MVRRPLFLVSACLVILTAFRLNMGWTDEGNPDCAVGGSFDGAVVWVTGQVYQKDEESVYIKDIILQNANRKTKSEHSNSSAANSQQPFSNLICEIKNAEAVPLGSQVTLSGTFTPFSRAGNPGEFDGAIYYRSLGLCGKIRDGQLINRSASFWKIREWLFDLNSQLSKRLYAALPQEDAAIMEAMLLGEQGNIDRDIKDLYRRNGILHILSISGMHISIVGMCINKILRRLGLPMQMAAIGGGLFLLAYGGLTGFGLSAMRAIGMYLIRMLGEVAGRTYDMLTAVGAVGCCMVLQNPYYLQNSGFLLSFSCVLGIGILYPVLLPQFKRYQGDNRPCNTLWEKGKEYVRRAEFGRKTGESFFLSLSVTLATLPVQLWFYYEVPTFSVFLNLLVVPFLKPLLLAGVITMIVPESVLSERIVSAVFGLYEYACRSFDRLLFHTWNPGCPEVWQIVAYYCVLAAAIWRLQRMKERGKKEAAVSDFTGTLENNRKVKGKQLICSGVCACLLCGGVCLMGVHPRQRSTVTFLDVGQGSCTLVCLSSGENYLFDCGSTGRSNVGQYVLLPYLKYEGIRKIDAVFVSHPDTDHSNGILELFELREEKEMQIDRLVLPDIREEAKAEEFGDLLRTVEETDALTQITYISEGDVWECEAAKFLCLHPRKAYGAEDSNEYSQCIYAEFSEGGQLTGSLLLTGDVGGDGEADLVRAAEEYDVGQITVFQCAHHGSRYSNSEELLDVISPKVTVISAGKDNSYGHPHEETMDRLRNVGAMTFVTSDCGMVQVEMGKRVRVTFYNLGQNR